MKLEKKIAILIMAAGGSRRLGQAKQLLAFKESTLLDNSIQESLVSGIGEVYVVLGGYRNEILSQLESKDVHIIVNENWEEGLGSSISRGVTELMKKDFDGVIIVLTDQLYLNKRVLLNLIERSIETKARIVISNYKEGSGPPSYFDASLFSELVKLKGDDGAKEIVKKYRSEVSTIYFEKGYLDIDEEDDIRLLEEFE